MWDATTGHAILTVKARTASLPAVTFSPDGKRFAARNEDETLTVWQADGGHEAFTLTGSALAFSPDGKQIATVSSLDTVTVYDATSGRTTVSFKKADKAPWAPFGEPVVISPDGSRVFTRSGFGTLTLWELNNGREILKLNETHPRPKITFSADGKRFSVQTDRGTGVWDVDTGRESLLMRPTGGAIACMAFSPDGNRIVSGDSDGTLKIWHGDSGQEILTIRAHERGVSEVAFSPDGKQILSTGLEARLWDGAHSQEILPILEPDRRPGPNPSKGEAIGSDGRPTDLPGGGHSVAFSPDGQRIALGGMDGVGLWDADSGRSISKIESPAIAPHNWVKSVAFHPNGKWIVFAREGRARVWDTESRQDVLTLAPACYAENTAVSADGKRIIACGGEKNVAVWDADNGQVIFNFEAHDGVVRGLAFSPDSKFFATASQDNTVKVWDANTARFVCKFTADAFGVSCVAFSPDSQQIVFGTEDGAVRVGNALNGQELRTFWPSGKGQSSQQRAGPFVVTQLVGHDPLYSVIFSPDGKRIVAATTQRLHVFDARTGQLLTTNRELCNVHSLAFSPDGRRLAAGRDIWNLPESVLEEGKDH
jgi:WD40 repeat protein